MRPADRARPVVFIPGGCGDGYGRELGLGFAREGATVVVTSRFAGRARARASELARAGADDAWGASCDPCDAGAVRRLVGRIRARFGRLDVAVCNASEVVLKPLDRYTEADFVRVLRVNVWGAFLCAREAAAAMRRGGGGSIVLMSSVYGMVSPDFRIYGDSGLDSPTAYGAAKAAVIQMARDLAVRWAGDRVRVNAVVPGGRRNGQPDSFVRRYSDRVPVGRMAGDRDLFGVVRLLAGDGASYLTGQAIVVDGGLTAW